MPTLPLPPCYGGYHRWGVKYTPAPPTTTTTIAHEVAATNQLKKKKGAGNWKHSGKPKTYPRGTDTNMCNRREGMVGSKRAPTPQLRQAPHTTREIAVTIPQHVKMSAPCMNSQNYTNIMISQVLY